jgi:ribosomal protein L37E
MAIINCPGCGKKTTEISPKCPHCGFDRSVESNDRIVELQRRKLRDHVYHLKMISYGVISLFLAGFGWYWWDTEGFYTESSNGPVILLAVVSLGYLAIRVLLFVNAQVPGVKHS